MTNFVHLRTLRGVNYVYVFVFLSSVCLSVSLLVQCSPEVALVGFWNVAYYVLV